MGLMGAHDHIHYYAILQPTRNITSPQFNLWQNTDVECKIGQDDKGTLIGLGPPEGER